MYSYYQENASLVSAEPGTSVCKKKWLLFESTRLAGIEASEHNSEKASHSETKGADVMLICLVRFNSSSNAVN